MQQLERGARTRSFTLMGEREPAVYILASGYPGTLYIGVTGNIRQRMEQHKQGVPGSFSTRYDVNRLVNVEFYATMQEAIGREKQLKLWKRDWKIKLIRTENPSYKDLSEDC